MLRFGKGEAACRRKSNPLQESTKGMFFQSTRDKRGPKSRNSIRDWVAKSIVAVVIVPVMWQCRRWSFLLRTPAAPTARMSEARFQSLEPPRELMVHGRLVAEYTNVPTPYNRTFHLRCDRGIALMRDAFQKIGWTEVDTMETAHVVYCGLSKKKNEFYKLKPWQRFSRIPGTHAWEGKDSFLIGFRNYAKQQLQQQQQQQQTFNNRISSLLLGIVFGNRQQQAIGNDLATIMQEELYFLPETYILREEEDRNLFHKRLYQHNGLQLPWVLKKTNVNNGKGIEILGSNSEALETAISRVQSDTTTKSYIVQSYICNELVWGRRGQKFDLRFFWFVLSVDPPIVLFHDGYARIAKHTYNESDFSSTGQHLTNHNYRDDNTNDGTKDQLWNIVREHYTKHYDYLSNKLRRRHYDSNSNSTFIEEEPIDPVVHVRNQIKEALGTFSFVYLSGETKTFANRTTKKGIGPENLFGLYGCDFIIDNDLDVYFIESQTAPGFPVSQSWKKDTFQEIFTPIPLLVEEMITKQQQDPRGNLLPLHNLGSYELVRAGDWQFKYEGYQRSKQKKGCTTQTNIDS